MSLFFLHRFIKAPRIMSFFFGRGSCSGIFFTFPKLFSCEAFLKFPKVSAHFLYKIPYSKVLKNKKINQAKGVVQQAAF